MHMASAAAGDSGGTVGDTASFPQLTTEKCNWIVKNTFLETGCWVDDSPTKRRARSQPAPIHYQHYANFDAEGAAHSLPKPTAEMSKIATDTALPMQQVQAAQSVTMAPGGAQREAYRLQQELRAVEEETEAANRKRLRFLQEAAAWKGTLSKRASVPAFKEAKDLRDRLIAAEQMLEDEKQARATTTQASDFKIESLRQEAWEKAREAAELKADTDRLRSEVEAAKKSLQKDTRKLDEAKKSFRAVRDMPPPLPPRMPDVAGARKAQSPMETEAKIDHQVANAAAKRSRDDAELVMARAKHAFEVHTLTRAVEASDAEAAAALSKLDKARHQETALRQQCEELAKRAEESKAKVAKCADDMKVAESKANQKWEELDGLKKELREVEASMEQTKFRHKWLRRGKSATAAFFTLAGVALAYKLA